MVVLLHTSVKVNQRLLRNLSLDITLRLQFLHLLQRGIVGIHVCSVVLVVVELHDLAGDGGLKGAIIVYKLQHVLAIACYYRREVGIDGILQGKSGNVALFLWNVVPANAALLVVEEAVVRRAERRALFLRREVDMFASTPAAWVSEASIIS